MVLKLFNGKNLLFQVAFLLVFLISMLNRDVILHEPQGFGPIYSLIYQGLAGSPIIIFISFVTLVIVEGLLLQLIASAYNLVSRNNYIVLLIWLLLVFTSPTLASINPVLISTVIITWALFQLLAITEKANPLPNLFSVGFIFSFASLIYGNLIWFVLFLITALLILSLFKGRTILVSLISFSLPYIYFFAYSFVMDQDVLVGNLFHFNFNDWGFSQNGLPLWISITVSILFIGLSIISVSSVLLHLKSQLIQKRSVVKVLFAWLLASILLQFLSGTWWFTHPILIFVPITLFISIFLDGQKKTIYYDILIWGLIVLEIVQLYYPQNA